MSVMDSSETETAIPETETPTHQDSALTVKPARSVALYIDGDNQSPLIVQDLLDSIHQGHA